MTNDQSERNNWEDEVELRTYLVILLRRWWVILLTVLVAVIGVWLTNPEALALSYESRVRLMLVPPVSEGLLNGGTGSSFASGMSEDILVSLATGNDLSKKIVSSLDLRDDVSGEIWAANRLSAMLNVSVQPDGGGPGLPLITVVVRGINPSRVKLIADAWSEEFIRQNQALFVSKAVRSYDFVLAQHDQTQIELLAARQERKEYQEENSVFILRQELSLKQEHFREFQDALLATSAELTLTESRYELAIERLVELTVQGVWIGADFDGRNVNENSLSTPEQIAINQAKEALIRAQENMLRFEAETELGPLEDGLALQMGRLANDQLQLRNVEGEHEVEMARLRRMELEIETLPEFLVTFIAVDNQTLWEQLGTNPTADDWERIRDLGLRNEQVNPVYTNVTSKIIFSRATIDSQEQLISHLEGNIEEAEGEINALQNEFSEIMELKDTNLPLLEIQSRLAQRQYDMERERYDALQDDVAILRAEVRTLDDAKGGYQGLVEQYQSDVRNVSNRLPSIDLKNQELDQQNQQLQTRFDELSRLVYDSEIAKQDELDTILVLETAVETETPVPVGGPGFNRLLIGVVLGLVLGVSLVFGFNYISPLNSTNREPPMS